ncbi:DUF1203 domain-containing protein [Sneathiella sp. CAU 1612]|uniref:DUF1203 domain-containing protein n=1 Tax=Sneathiella sedimenti TaxID=2816034 RepID=A0ABS3F4I1_9PROT|nr:DUF1203 domain-containing protein [Sneathiella sedimenti]MBO0333435.1 DUF1203 domain-containing protein [Sneathiella sedimenti]
MTKLAYFPLPTDRVRAIQNGGMDAHGNAPERFISDGSGLSCRHCLSHIAAGEEYLLLSYRPFPAEQPFAEQGPIFLHAKECPAFDEKGSYPAMVKEWNAVLLRGYSRDDRLVYGTGQAVPPDRLVDTATAILATKDVAYVHARSATNNCYQFRIEAAR